MGFRYVESGPLVRSSYHAEKHLFDWKNIQLTT
jgi:lipoic acid synthetase